MVFNGQARKWFFQITKPFFISEKRALAFSLLTLLIVLLVSVSSVNVASSYVQQYFMTALSERRQSDFYNYALLYVGMFALATIIAVTYRFTEDSLGLAWRKWLTSHFVDRYLNHQAYQRVAQDGAIDNPDQRISEDVRVFTSTTLSFVLILVNATITIFSFAGVLWGITPWLFFAAVGYALFGSLTTLFVGQTLTKLNVAQLKKEADFRYDLVKIRQQADAVAVEHDEAEEKSRLKGSLQALYANFKSIIAVNRNIGFFTTGYNYITQILPILIVAPLYISGKVDFGVVTQATTAFIFALGAFSVFITEFQRISSFSAVVERLGALWDATSPPAEAQQVEAAKGSELSWEPDGDRIAVENLTLSKERPEGTPVQDLSFDLPLGSRMAVTGPRGAGKSLLLRALAGTWHHGHGRIVRPDPPETMFLSSNPHLKPCRLRDLLRPREAELAPEQLKELIDAAQLRSVCDRIGGVDVHTDWSRTVSLRDQQLLAMARLCAIEPDLALLDEPMSEVDWKTARLLYELLRETGVSYISVFRDPGLSRYHDFNLQLHGDGAWTLQAFEHSFHQLNEPSTRPEPVQSE